jgi:hypothetical protein
MRHLFLQEKYRRSPFELTNINRVDGLRASETHQTHEHEAHRWVSSSAQPTLPSFRHEAAGAEPFAARPFPLFSLFFQEIISERHLVRRGNPRLPMLRCSENGEITRCF